MAASSNLVEFSVSELSQALKRVVESQFDLLRVRGEISGFKRAASGHLYMSLKDESSVIDAVCWRGSTRRLECAPEDGLDVIVTGRLTTYPGRSKYQLVIEQMQLAGLGALMKLFEDRKKKLEAEGLFDPDRKKPIPYLPNVIGVVTSPTGAVIRDILHRLGERFASHVIVCPVLVQGDGASRQIAGAIEQLNAIPTSSNLPRPDLIIVARGGGSIEDLWAFNEEEVVRAAAASAIPLISAVGHETDTTLIDYASDLRAPTPTAAAELAVPVRRELMAKIEQLRARLSDGSLRFVANHRRHLQGLARGLPEPRMLMNHARQRLDDQTERLSNAGRSGLQRRQAALDATSGRLRSPAQLLAMQRQELDRLASILNDRAQRMLERQHERLGRLSGVPEKAVSRKLEEKQKEIRHISTMMESLSHQRVLERGYAIVRAKSDGRLVSRKSGIKGDTEFSILFADGEVETSLGKPGRRKTPPAPQSSKSGEQQGTLL